MKIRICGIAVVAAATLTADLTEDSSKLLNNVVTNTVSMYALILRKGNIKMTQKAQWRVFSMVLTIRDPQIRTQYGIPACLYMHSRAAIM